MNKNIISHNTTTNKFISKSSPKNYTQITKKVQLFRENSSEILIDEDAECNLS